MHTLFLVLGSLLPIVSSVTYIVSILRGKTRPERMTRFLMVIITAIMTTSLWLGGDTSGVWLALVSFLQAVFILALTFKHGMGGTDRLDFICLGLCAVGVALWMTTDHPWVGLIASIAADCIAVLPSLRKTIRLPHTESIAFYALDTLAGLFILAAGPYTLSAMLFPAYIVAINFVFVLAIEWPRAGVTATKAEEIEV